MWETRDISMRYLMILLAMVSILSMKVLTEECPTGSKDKIMKSLEFYNSTNHESKFDIIGIEYDPKSSDFFYSGVGFISRSNIEGTNLWIKKPPVGVVHNSLVYLTKNTKLYHTGLWKNGILLAGLNSTNGEYIESYQIDYFKQSNTESMCIKSKDESTIF